MKTQIREATEIDLNEFFIQDEDGFFLKEKNNPSQYEVEEGIEGAQMFSEIDALEVIENNLDRNFILIVVGSILDTNKYEILQEIN